MIQVENVVKQYGKKTVLDHISFEVGKGEVLGLLGKNGAGKSTTMNIITGNLTATEGTARIDGYDIMENPLEAKKNLGFLPELPPLYPEMTVKNYLQFVYRLKKAEQPRDQHIKEICEQTGIQEVSDRVIRHLSKGYCQRLGIAQALIGNPEVLILDEPMVGLDPKQIVEIRGLIGQLKKNAYHDSFFTYSDRGAVRV
ncbi:MAG: ABC transporter ATP-binding protein [Lachnospiraceae bacterium]|nr:ABC transporter ATP-binding protein [Lachnospiraceae bacterium]